MWQHIFFASQLLNIFLHVAADLPTIQPDEGLLYDNGTFGRVPNSRVRSTNSVASRTARLTWDEEACHREGEYYFAGYHAILLGHSGPMVFDNEGHEVWRGKGFGSCYNFMTQMYKGKPYLTWWGGNDQVRGHGEGFYYMFDDNYQMYKNVSAIGDGMRGDLHEFLITKDDTALLTIYHTIPFDLSAWGVEAEDGTTGYIRDCLFQEIDLETNELLYEWRASEHVRLEDCYTKPHGEGKSALGAWDWFHINSVDKDEYGNYLVSSRYAHALFYIDGKTSETIWTIGGMNNSFTDLSDGRIINIERQHHARWAGRADGGDSNSRYITVFDNGNTAQRVPSRGLKFLVNPDDMTLELMAEARHPNDYISASQGSIQQLDNGNLLVGWGYAPGITEFSPDGTKILCDMEMASMHFNGTWSPGGVEIYRSYRLPWQGFPLEPPALAVDRKADLLFVSWNGATELSSWRLQGLDKAKRVKRLPQGDEGYEHIGENDGEPMEEHNEDNWLLLQEVQRQGFETNISVSLRDQDLLKLTALGKDARILGSWTVSTRGTIVEEIVTQVTSAADLQAHKYAEHPSSGETDAVSQNEYTSGDDPNSDLSEVSGTDYAVSHEVPQPDEASEHDASLDYDEDLGDEGVMALDDSPNHDAIADDKTSSTSPLVERPSATHSFPNFLPLLTYLVLGFLLGIVFMLFCHRGRDAQGTIILSRDGVSSQLSGEAGRWIDSLQGRWNSLRAALTLRQERYKDEKIELASPESASLMKDVEQG